jgi:hypothetical protein
VRWGAAGDDSPGHPAQHSKNTDAEHDTAMKPPTTARRILMNQRHPAVRTRVRLLALSVAVSVGLATALAPTTAQAVNAAPAARSVGSEATLAQRALAQATARTRAHQLVRARRSLAAVRSHSTAANRGALNLVGAPPTDPESDDPPGPPAVIRVVRLDFQLGTGAAALFNGHSATLFVRAVRRTVWAVQTRRAAVLAKVVGLAPEGDRTDYADGMADVLPIFTREVTFFTTALRTYRLSSTARSALNAALARARAARTSVQGAFGGGERPASTGR